MEIDAASSASSDSHIGNYCHNVNNLNYYSDNFYFTANCRLDNYFADDKIAKKVETTTNGRADYYKRDDYCALVNPVHSNNKGVLNKCDATKRTFSYNNSECFGKKVDDVGNRTVQLDYYNNNSNNSNIVSVDKKVQDGTIQLNNVDSYGKKPMSFSPDQVSTVSNVQCGFI